MILNLIVLFWKLSKSKGNQLVCTNSITLKETCRELHGIKAAVVQKDLIEIKDGTKLNEVEKG